MWLDLSVNLRVLMEYTESISSKESGPILSKGSRNSNYIFTAKNSPVIDEALRNILKM